MMITTFDSLTGRVDWDKDTNDDIVSFYSCVLLMISCWNFKF